MRTFDELRENIRANSVELYTLEIVGKDRALALVDAAEAKWQEGCCEWEHKRYHANCLCKCNGNYIMLDYDLVSTFKVCPYCTKHIKIVEVDG